MYKLELNVQEPYYSFIKSGVKTVEGRLAKERFLSLNPGDKVLVNNDIVVEVLRVNKYVSFRSMLESEGFKKAIPDANDIEYALSVYYGFYQPADEQKYGVVAIEIKVLPQSK